MEKKLILKMIQNSFRQYKHNLDSIPLNERDYDELYEQIIEIKKETDADLHDIINDVIYEFLTK
ncbi:MAG TPA: YqzH family protein [Pseudoneobacillus sp.]|nr:YqzH family protein [Pseudoneobacillus sp.]